MYTISQRAGLQKLFASMEEDQRELLKKEAHFVQREAEQERVENAPRRE